MIDVVGIEHKAARFLVVGPTGSGYASATSVTKLYLERRPGELVPTRMTWHRTWSEATTMTLEDAVHYCVQMEDCWVEEVKPDYLRHDLDGSKWTYKVERI